MRNILKCVITCSIIILWGIACKGTIQAHTTHSVPRDSPMLMDEVVELRQPETPDQIVPEVRLASFEDPFYRRPILKNLTEEDWYLLESISLAEAGNQGVEGVALIQWVVLNRCERSGQSVRQVIYAENQFYTVGMNGTNELSHEARALIEDGWDESQGALYFRTGHYHDFGTPLFQYKAHYFSGK